MLGSNIHRIKNLLISIIAVILEELYFLASNSDTFSSLESQSKQAISMDEVMTNGKPTVLEFYSHGVQAKAMGPNLAKLKRNMLRLLISYA